LFSLICLELTPFFAYFDGVIININNYYFLPTFQRNLYISVINMNNSQIAVFILTKSFTPAQKNDENKLYLFIY